MGIEKREGEDKLPTSRILDPETAPVGPEAPTTDIVDGDEVVKTAEEIAGEMNAENPEGPEYAPKGTEQEPPPPEADANDADDDGNYEDDGTKKKTEKGTPGPARRSELKGTDTVDRNDLAVGLKNVIAEGDAAVKEFLALLEKEELENLYDSMDEYLVSIENETDEDDEEDEEEEEVTQ